MNTKINSIKAHASQINPMFSGDLKLDFYQIIEERNRLDAMNIHSEIYVEGFTKIEL